MAPDTVRRAALTGGTAGSSNRDPGIAGQKQPNASAGFTNLLALSATLLPCYIAEQLVLDSITDLIIVPSGKLNLVPFAALPLPNGELLGIKYRLSFAPSFTSLLVMETNAARNPGRALIVGNPTMPMMPGSTKRMNPLPGSQVEATVVAERLGASAILRGEATEAAIRDSLPQAEVIHLATHGFAYGTEKDAGRSFIALAPGAGHDGVLSVEEILSLPHAIPAWLIVLSACQTALGSLDTVEGTIGLPWAFLSKGARTVLVSLWNVDDDVTTKLMDRFYTHLTNGASKSESLRGAQEDVRKTYPNPRLWAAFQLVGAAD
jgi:CHAT domain-containing protein